ncbi:MAG: hypothetical protein JO353_09715, partial [Phycisphaerae bacterium]|nr:hypothetical protein [Phycisphaerae bacterium]
MANLNRFFLRGFLRAFAPSCLLFFSFGMGGAQTTQPIDLSSPKQSVATMFAAVTAADTATLKRVFFADSPQATELVSAYADLIAAAKRLRDSARSKFATDTPNPAMVRDSTTPGAPSPEQAAQLAAADVNVDGNSATVKIPDRPAPIKLRRVDGNWLIDV